MMLNHKDRLSRLLFLEFNRSKAAEIFSAPSLGEEAGELYVPINPDFLIRKIYNNEVPKDLPISEFILGMAYALALDPSFTYAPQYRRMLKGFSASEAVLRKKISELIRDGKKEEGFILVRGLYDVTGEEETENLLLSLGEELALKDPEYADDVIELATQAIENGNRNGYLIRGSLKRADGKDAQSLADFRAYTEAGGEKTDELAQIMEELDRNTKAEEAYGILYQEPQKALAVFLDLYARERDNARLVYSIAVAYRLLGNHEKAILYLEEAQAVDPGFLDVLNEMGLNYALLEDYGTAAGYFRKVYETTRELAPLTNLIICLFNLNENTEALTLYQEALEMDPADEILEEIRKIYLG